MRVLITGAGGFIGQELAAAFLQDPQTTEVILTDINKPPIPDSASKHASKASNLAADLTDPSCYPTLFTGPLDAVYLLHGIMSAGSEANLDLGLRVNWDSTRHVLDHLRTHHTGVKVIYTSACAVYGPQAPDAVTTELSVAIPQGSYGAQKLMCETLLNDLSRRGALDGRICRLPTIVVRPGKPTAAASSFASGILREPLLDQEAVLPVARELRLWICSPRVVIRNLVYAAQIPKEKFERYKSRLVNLPGRTVSVEEMLLALEKVGGERARKLVKEERDESVEAIVYSWATNFDTGRAEELGFVDDQSLEETVQDFVEGYVKK